MAEDWRARVGCLSTNNNGVGRGFIDGVNVLVHHVLGRSAGIDTVGDALRAAGHHLHVPDLFDGRIYATIEEGVAPVEETDLEALMARGLKVADSLAGPFVYAGFSIGALPTQKLVQTRPGTAGPV